MKHFGTAICLVGMMVVTTTTQAQGIAQASDGHKVLKHDEGVWDAKITMWMGGQEMTSKGTETNRMIGDFWVVSNFEGEFGGMPFQGHGTFGFDPETKKYHGSWMDSTSPNITKMEGTYDAESKTMTHKTMGKDPAGNPMAGKNVTVYKDKDTRVMTMYQPDPENPDKMVKSMEIVYTRKPGATEWE